MTRMISRLADRLLRAIADDARAGACAPDHGDTYWNSCGSHPCYPGDRYQRKYCQYEVSCSGYGVPTGASYCQATQSICPG